MIRKLRKCAKRFAMPEKLGLLARAITKDFQLNAEENISAE